MSGDFIRCVHNLVMESPLGAAQLALALGKPYSTLLREVNPYDTGAKLGAETLIKLMEVTNNYTPLQLLAEQNGFTLEPKK